jgi:NADH-quinone oxidoreductase subunit M
MVYDRVHTRELTELEGLGLARVLPFAAVTFTLASVASMGMPGFSGFIAELQVLIGAWKSDPLWAVAGGIGVLVGIAFTLRVLQAAFFGDREKPIAVQANAAGSLAPAHNPVPPISLPERCGAILLLVVTTAVGLYPRILIDLIAPCLKTPLFHGLTEGGAL